MNRRKIILESPHGCRLGECNYAVGQEINYSGVVDDKNKKRNQMRRQMIPFFLLDDSTYQKR